MRLALAIVRGVIDAARIRLGRRRVRRTLAAADPATRAAAQAHKDWLDGGGRSVDVTHTRGVMLRRVK